MCFQYAEVRTPGAQRTQAEQESTLCTSPPCYWTTQRLTWFSEGTFLKMQGKDKTKTKPNPFWQQKQIFLHYVNAFYVWPPSSDWPVHSENLLLSGTWVMDTTEPTPVSEGSKLWGPLLPKVLKVSKQMYKKKKKLQHLILSLQIPTCLQFVSDFFAKLIVNGKTEKFTRGRILTLQSFQS